MYARAKSGSPTKVAAIALPSLVELQSCADHVVTTTWEAERVVLTLYRFAAYTSPYAPANGLYRREGRVVCPPKDLRPMLDRLFSLYADLFPAQVA